MKTKIIRALQDYSSIVLLVIFWQLLSATGMFGKYDDNMIKMVLPSPFQVAGKMADITASGYLLENILVSFVRVIAGFAIGAGVGIPVGILMGYKRSVKKLVYPLFKIIAPIPGVAWIPLAIIWFGLGNDAAVFIIAMSAITPICINTMQGVEEIDPALKDLFLTLKANLLQKTTLLIIPSIVPYVITGMKLGLGYSWRVVLAAEMVGVPGGLGYVLNLGRSTAQTEITFIIIIVLGIMMTLMEKVLFSPLERITEKWKEAEKN